MAYVPKACGFVVAREARAGLEYLLLVSRKWDEAGFPKGHVDAGESEIETARREAREETGLVGLGPLPGFREVLEYPVRRQGRTWQKASVYFLARVGAADVRLSDEHTEAGWFALSEARRRLPFEGLRRVLRRAALHLKDAALFDQEPASEAQADAWLCTLPEAREGTLLGHVRGAARIARALARALAARGLGVHEEGTAVGALLHDTGRALGRHDEHQLAGVECLRGTPLAPYAFACISHFTKGASASELQAAGLADGTVAALEAAFDAGRFTWEEKCVALADACMRQDEPVPPEQRFADLRRRYADAAPLVDLQERRTAAIRRELGDVLGQDPLTSVGPA